MKLLQNSNKILLFFLIGLFLVNLIQAYNTELLSDEAYYWVYSNFLDWGYFDHPPMVAIWITISKFFFSTSELSVRFFSTLTLPITFYFLWLLIDHPKKQENTWLFILLIASTSLFNAYGFVTVPDTPLLFFMGIFLLGYKKYVKVKTTLSYVLLTIGITGMIYSKYQAILIVFFVLLSNYKVLKDYKIWIMTICVILLYTPHLYWQYNNDFPSFKYHLVERTQGKSYKLKNSLMLFVNMLAIVGFTFPILYSAIFKNFKNKDAFQRALNFIFIGFIGFFFISTFKGPTQAQWIVPISFPLIIIAFNYIVDHLQIKKTFIRLAYISIIVITGIRFAMVYEILPKQMEMHGNKSWVTRLHKKLNGKEVIFSNSFQKPSIYWFYSGHQPFQYNVWHSRKNHYDLLAYNTSLNINEIVKVGTKRFATDSLPEKNHHKLYLRNLYNYKREGVIISSNNKAMLTEGSKNRIKIEIENPNNIDLKKLNLQVIFRDKKRNTLKTLTTQDHKNNPQVFNAKLVDTNFLEFNVPSFPNDFSPAFIQVIGSINKKVEAVRVGTLDCVLDK